MEKVRHLEGKELEATRRFYNPCLVVLAGVSLMGKTTLGDSLASETNFTFLDVDRTRWSIFRKEADQGYPGELPEPLVDFAMITSYTANHEKARALLRQGQPVILAASYSREPYHEMFKWLQEVSGVPAKVFLLEMSGGQNIEEEEIEKRLKQRLREGNVSNVKTMEHYLKMKNRQHAMEGVDLVRINAGKPVEEIMQEILLELKTFQVKV